MSQFLFCLWIQGLCWEILRVVNISLWLLGLHSKHEEVCFSETGTRCWMSTTSIILLAYWLSGTCIYQQLINKWEGFCHDVDHSRSQSQSAHFSLWDQICTRYIHVLRSHLGVLMEFMRSFSVCVSTSALSAAGDLQKFVAALKDGSWSNSQSSSWLPDVFLLYTMYYAYFRNYSHPCATLH